MSPDPDTMLAALQRLEDAIVNEGPHPEYHHQVLDRHRAEWPTLWAAIDHARHVLHS